MSTQPAPPRRIGVFGGAFDPPHRGHTALAQAALDHLDLDLLLVVPTGTAWHKTRPLSDAQYRLAMCALAFGDVSRAQIDDCEIVRSGPSYTVDTLQALHQAYPGAAFFLLMGQDQAQRLGTWSRAEALPNLASLCVAPTRCRTPSSAPQSWRCTLALPHSGASASTRWSTARTHRARPSSAFSSS